MYLSWIIPAYNEEKRIGKTLREVDVYLRARQPADGYEIIVVNSLSTDQTAAVVDGMHEEIAHLKIIHAKNKGKGWAVKQGMLAAQGSVRIFSDADNSTAPSYFDAMEPFFKQGFDVVISSRDPKDAKGASRDVKEPWYRELLGNMGNIIIQVVGVWGIWDTQNGFKAFTAKVAEELFSCQRVSGWAFDIEILALARRCGYRVAVIPIQWRFEADSKVTLKAYLQVFADVFKIRWNLLTGMYRCGSVRNMSKQ